MATFTDNIGLKKPDGIDQVMVKDLNDNFDAIDHLIASGATAKGLKPSGLYPTYEDMINSVASADVGTTFMVGKAAPYALYTWTGSEWTYVGTTSPVRGVDFWTQEDIDAIEQDVKKATDKIDNMTVDAESGDHSDAQISEVDGAKHIHFVLEKGDPGRDGYSPRIGSNGNWYIGDTDTGIHAQGEQGDPGYTPYIGANGNWFVDIYDTGIHAQGIQGEPGTPGTTPHIDEGGNWFVGAVDTGIKAQGEKGDTGDTPRITFEASTGEPGTDVQIVQGGTVDEPVIHLTIPRGEQGKPGTGSGTVNSVNDVPPDVNGNVTIEIPEKYVLPAASGTVLGGVKIGENLSIDGEGVLSAQSGLPAGGASGQVLAKASDEDHDAQWIDPPSGSVTAIKLNNETYTPDSDTGVVDLGVVDSGGVNGVMVNGELKEPDVDGVIDLGGLIETGNGTQSMVTLCESAVYNNGTRINFNDNIRNYRLCNGKLQSQGFVPTNVSNDLLLLFSVRGSSNGFTTYYAELAIASNGLYATLSNAYQTVAGSSGISPSSLSSIRVGPIYGTKLV